MGLQTSRCPGFEGAGLPLGIRGSLQNTMQTAPACQKMESESAPGQGDPQGASHSGLKLRHLWAQPSSFLEGRFPRARPVSHPGAQPDLE